MRKWSIILTLFFLTIEKVERSGNLQEYTQCIWAELATERAYQIWFLRLRLKNFAVDDAPRTDRPNVINSNRVKERVKTSNHLTIRDIFHISESSVFIHLHTNVLVSKLDVWIPDKLTEANSVQRIFACNILLKWKEKES